MEVLAVFLEEIYDYELQPSVITNYIDSKTNSLKMGNILKDPMLASNLCFRFLWRNVTGVYPSKQHGMLFMTTQMKSSGDVDVPNFLSFLKDKVPIFQYINVDTDNLIKAKTNFLQELGQTSNVKSQLAIKFCYRYGLDQDTIDTSESLFAIFRKCVFSPEGYTRIQNMNNTLSKILEKEPLDIPDVPETLVSYYKVSSDMIEHFELFNYNIFNGYWLPLEHAPPPNTTVFDAINYLTTTDSNFYRMLLGTTIIYWCDGDVFTHDRLKNLIDAANTKESQRNIVLFKNIDSPNIDHDTDYYYYEYKVADTFLLNFVPKIASNYVLIGKDVFPRSPNLSSKTDTSLYYCLYDGQIPTHQDKLPTYYTPFSRYITIDKETKTAIHKIGVDKHVYIIVDATDTTNIVFNKEFQEHQWTAHLTEYCPYNALKKGNYTPKMNVLLYDQFVFEYYTENRQNIDAFDPRKGQQNCVILVDNRPNIFSVISLYITMSNIRSALWTPVVVCNKDNMAFFKRFFGDKVEYVTKFKMPTKKFAIDTYNYLLKDPQFWNAFSQYKKALFVQDDGMVVMKGLENEFLDYDYVGAPWRKDWATQNPNKFLIEQVNPQLVGNGGVSLRDIKHMKFICEKYRHLSKSLHYDMIQQSPEDVMFCRFGVQEGLKMPDYDTAQKFSAEQVCDVKSHCFHKVYAYHDLDTVERFFEKYVAPKKNEIS